MVMNLQIPCVFTCFTLSDVNVSKVRPGKAQKFTSETTKKKCLALAWIL